MWYRASNRNCSFISQIANKESRTRFYTALVKDLTTVQAPSTSDATSLLEDGEDTHNNSEDHYWMSKKPARSRDLRQWLSENEADRALTVSLNPLVCHPDTEESSNSTFELAFSIIYSRVSEGPHTVGTNTTSLIKTAMTSS